MNDNDKKENTSRMLISRCHIHRPNPLAKSGNGVASTWSFKNQNWYLPELFEVHWNQLLPACYDLIEINNKFGTLKTIKNIMQVKKL